MRTRSAAYSLFAAVGVMLSSAAVSQGPSGRRADLPPGARIAVVASNSRGGSQVDTVVSEMLISALRGRGWRVLERLDLEAVMKEHQLARSGVVDPDTAVAAGQVVGAEYILTARATEFGVRDSRIGGLFGLGPFGGLQVRTATGRVVLEARVVDVRTGEVLGSASGEGKVVNYGGTLVGGSWRGGAIDLGGVDVNSKEWSESLLGRAARKAVDGVMRRLLGSEGIPAGRVLAVTDDGICIVSLGADDGIRTGDALELVRVEAIRDRRGAPVWTEEVRIGRLRVTEVRSDRAKAAVAEGDRPQEADLVRPAGRVERAGRKRD